MGKMLAFLLFACAPDEGLAVSAYTPDDALAFVDGAEGRVRAHYSDRGPNAADQTDQDEDDVPDQAEYLAAATESALRFYGTLGFAAPLSESEVGLDPVGGSDALDVYLLTDGPFGAFLDGCVGARCAVHLVAPADDGSFDLGRAAFYAVMAAYDVDEPAWLAEGAAWHMSNRLDGGSLSNIGDGDAWLRVPSCGLAAMVRGNTCRGAADGAGLMWWYLADAVGPDVLRDTIEATVTLDGVDALEAGLAANDARLDEVWPEIVACNLETGPRADRDGCYSFGSMFEGVTADAEGATVRTDTTLVPLSARYYRVDHGGGAFSVAASGDLAHLVATVHPVEDGAADGPLTEAIGPFALDGDPPSALDDVAAGGVWVAVSHVDAHADAADVHICIGATADVTPCASAVGCSSTGTLPTRSLPVLALLAALGARRRSRP
jgi:hypothetical protein